MMINIKGNISDSLEVKVKKEVNLDNIIFTKNEHPEDDSIAAMDYNYSSIKVTTEYEFIDNNELNNSLKQTNSSNFNFKCKEEIKEEQSQILNKIVTGNHQNVEDFSESSEIDEKIDISETILQSCAYNDNKFKLNSENDRDSQKALQIISPDEDPLKQYKKKKQCLTRNSHSKLKKAAMKICQFCNKSYKIKQTLDDHILKRHKQEIEGGSKSLITSKIHVCKICNSYKTTHKFRLDRHINSNHNEVKIKLKCQFCTKSLMCKQSLEGHVLRKHKDKIENNIKSVITSKIHVCNTCNSFETTQKSSLTQHIKSVHNEVNIKKKCEFCSKSFTWQQSLTNHVLRKHKGKIKGDIRSVITSKIHSCKMCSYESINKTDFDKHVNSVHNKKLKWKCEFCNDSFKFKYELNNHLLNQHESDVNGQFKNFVQLI